MKKKNILNIGSGKYQRYIIKQLAELGHKVYTTDIKKKAPGFKYAYKKIIIDRKNYKKIINFFVKQKIRPDIVITGCTRESIISTSKIAQRFNIKRLNIKTIKYINLKKTLSRKYNKDIYYGDNNYIKKDLEFPIIVKFINYSGSKGIYLVKEKSTLEKLIKSKKNEKFYIEKFIKAKHYIITGLKNKKIFFFPILEKFINNKFETKKIFRVNKNLNNQRIIKFISNILKEINFNFGPFSFEIFIDNKNNKIYIAEVENCIPGLNVPQIITKNFKLNYIKKLINIYE